MKTDFKLLKYESFSNIFSKLLSIQSKSRVASCTLHTHESMAVNSNVSKVMEIGLNNFMSIVLLTLNFILFIQMNKF